MKDEIFFAIQNADTTDPVCDSWGRQVELRVGIVHWGAEDLESARLLSTMELAEFLNNRARAEFRGAKMEIIRIITVRVEELPPEKPKYRRIWI